MQPMARPPAARPTIILFDGACNLCSGVVKFLVARNRYRWFGRAEACMVPTPELRSRFLG